MSLAETTLANPENWRPTEDGRFEISVISNGWTVHCSADRVESLGCALRHIDMRRDVPTPEDVSTLDRHAGTVAKRVTGLLELLRVVEVDPTTNIAILRSDAPPTKDGAVSFYEVRLMGRNHVSITRNQAATTSPARKSAIPFALTFEVIGKLLDDTTGETEISR